MTRQPMGRPEAGEYAPFYERYVAAVPEGDVLDALVSQRTAMRALVESMGDGAAGARPATGRWSVKDVVLHVADTERVMAYRLLRVARGDRTPLSGFDQDDFATAADAGARPLAELLDELEAVRSATITLVAGLAPEAYRRAGEANGAPVTVRGLAYVIAGHELHHLALLAGARASSPAASAP